MYLTALKPSARIFAFDLEIPLSPAILSKESSRIDTALVQVQETFVLRRGCYRREKSNDNQKSFPGYSLSPVSQFEPPVVRVQRSEKVSGERLRRFTVIGRIPMWRVRGVSYE